jgi:hypothetical protein
MPDARAARAEEKRPAPRLCNLRAARAARGDRSGARRAAKQLAFRAPDGLRPCVHPRRLLPAPESGMSTAASSVRWPLALCVGWLAAALLVQSCDNAACVFGPSNCQNDGTQGALGGQASLPGTGEWIASGAPLLDQFRPNGSGAHSRTPISLRFSESMDPGSLNNAFQLIQLGAGGLPGLPVPLTSTRIADGRLLVLLPTVPLTAGATYQIQHASGAQPRDRTGQSLVLPADLLVGTFTVAATDPTEISVLTQWPSDGAQNQSEISEIAVVFDRPIEAASVTAASWQVEVDGLPPSFDPQPAPVLVGVSPFLAQDSRAWRYRSLDDSGEPVPFGTAASVELLLSPAGSKIAEADNEDNELPELGFDFETADFSAPLGAALVSQPEDAIGIAHLTAGSGNELDLAVQLAGAQAGDVLTLYLFGENYADTPVLVALAREVQLTGAGPFLEVHVLREDFDLVLESSPLKAQFADGELGLALQLERGSVASPVRRVDFDTVQNGVQDALLDTLAPELLELLNPGDTNALFRSDQRDLVLAGRANEFVRAAEVVTTLGDNGSQAPVVGSSEDGLFLAAPVPLGALEAADLPLDYTITVFDRALNPAAAEAGSFSQLGAVGPDPLAAGGPIAVEVFDAHTLEPIEGALVATHADDGALDPVVQSAFTDADGRVIVDSAAGAATILSIDARDIGTALVDYDLFSLHGVPSARVSIPLQRASYPSASSGGTLGTTSPIAQLSLGLLGRRFADSRRPLFAEPTYAGLPCTSSPFGGGLLSCPFGPAPVRALSLGTQTAIAGSFLLSAGTFSPSALIQAFDLQIPLLSGLPGSVQATTIVIPFLLSEPDVPADLQPAALPTLLLESSFTNGIDTANLALDPAFTGEPRISVETLVPGVPGSAVVGLGLAFSTGPTSWSVRSAHPGAVGPDSELALDGSIDPDLRIRAVLRDLDGNLAGQRRRVSLLGSFLPVPNFLIPASVSQLSSPPDGGASGGASYELVIGNSLQDIQNEAGLYRVWLTDDTGRRWEHWKFDEPDAAGPSFALRVPDLGAAGGQGLANGGIEAVVQSFAWPDFMTSGSFLWSDIEREFDLHSSSAPTSFQQP